MNVLPIAKHYDLVEKQYVICLAETKFFLIPKTSSMPNVQTTSAATSRESRPITAVLYSGGSNGVGEWKVDNAVLNVARRPHTTAGTSTLLVK